MIQNNVEVNFWDYLRVVLKRKWIILQAIVVITSVSAVMAYYRVPIYVTSGRVIVKTTKNLKDNVINEFTNLEMRKDIETYLQLIKCRKYIIKTAVSLIQDFKKENIKLEEEFANGNMIKEEYDLYKKEIDRKKDAFYKYTLDDMQKKIDSMIKVSKIGEAKLINIDAKGKSPQIITTVLNRLINVFIEEVQKEELKSLHSTETFLTERLKIVTVNLKKYELEYQNFKENNESFIISATSQTDIKNYADIKSRLEKIEIERKSLDIKIGAYQKEFGVKTSSSEAHTGPVVNRALQKLGSRLSDLKLSLGTLRARYHDTHPKIIELNREIASLNKQMLKASTLKPESFLIPTHDNVQNRFVIEMVDLQAELQCNKAKKEILQKELKTCSKKFKSLPSEEIEFTRILRNKKIVEEIHLMLKKKISEIQILKAGHDSKIKIVDLAENTDDFYIFK